MRLVADYTRRIHKDGFTHRDLKWRNVLAETGEAPRIFFFDCPSGRHVSPLRRRHFIIRDLAGLDRLAREHLSRTMRLRFYLWYRNRTHLTREDKTLIAKVVTYSQPSLIVFGFLRSFFGRCVTPAAGQKLANPSDESHRAERRRDDPRS